MQEFATGPSPEAGSDLSDNGRAARIYRGVRVAFNWLAFIGVGAMLAVSLVIVSDVLMRFFLSRAIVALNEIVAMIFAVAVTATLPAGVVNRVNLKVELLANGTSPFLRHLLTAIGSGVLFLFFGLLAWEIWKYALTLNSQGRTTQILYWPIAPFFFCVGASLALAAVAQFFVALADIARFISWYRTASLEEKTARSSWGVRMVSFVMLVAVAVLTAWFVVDSAGLASAIMANPGTALLLAFGLLWLAILLQIPVAAAVALAGVLGGAAYIGFAGMTGILANEASGFLTNSQVATLPLFLMMGAFASVAGISADVYRLANALLGGMRGGLTYATIGGCAGFGAVTGSSIATAATFGRIALPEMRSRGYSPELAAGSVAAGGTLGALVPPSAPIILYALLTEQSIGQLFVAAIIPALLAVALYFAAIGLTVRLVHGAAPAPTPQQKGELKAALRGGVSMAVLFGIVIGGLYTGVFTATESAAVGAVGAFLLALLRGRINRETFGGIMAQTTATTAMIYALIFGALAFSFFVDIGQAPSMVTNFIGSLDVPPVIIILILLVFYLLLGAFLDSFAIMVITVPIVVPLILALGYDLVWWGILMLVVVEIGLITPPFGINLFVVKSLMPDVSLGKVFKGTLPFVAADVVKLLLLTLFPVITLWLPSLMMR